MLKKKVIPITARNSIDLKCSDCLHFQRVAKFDKPCEQLGIKKYGNAPNCFTVNPYILAKKNPDVLYQIGMLFHDFTPMERRAFMALLKQTNISKTHYQLEFGQPVYFYLNHDFLGNYFRGFVVGVASAGEDQVFITSNLNGLQRNNPMFASLFREQVFTASEFKIKRRKLIKGGRLEDPQPLSKAYARTAKAVTEDYVPPSMENAPSEWFDKYDKRLNSKKSLSTTKDGVLEFKVGQ